MMTESQALERWCPFARVHVPAGLINRVAAAMRRIASKARLNGNIADAEYIEEQEADTHCIGSKCMAWRGSSDTMDLPEGVPPPSPNWDKDGPAGAVSHRQTWTLRTGYCGLAGRP